MQTSRRGARGAFLPLLFIAAMTGVTLPAGGQTEPGVTSSEIVLGGTQPFSGPLGIYSAIGKGSQETPLRDSIRWQGARPLRSRRCCSSSDRPCA